MSEIENTKVTELFKQWRSGKAESGQVLAQRVSDWFYAICSSRYGDELGLPVFQSASRKFGEGIVSVAHSTDLIPWAHGLLCAEIQKNGLTPTSANIASPYSGGHPPVDLLYAAKSALPAEVDLLNAFFTGKADTEIEELALDLGGMPGALLHARYTVKQWLKTEYQLPFGVTPENPNIDLFPLPMYEANRMANEGEISGFEKWMLDNRELCQDVAEFGPFSSALRAGLPDKTESSDIPSTPTPVSTEQRLVLGITNLTFVLGILLVLVSLSAFAFIVAFSME